MSGEVCGHRLVLPINQDGDILGCREPEAHPSFVANVTKAVCELPPNHPGDHHRDAAFGAVSVSWSRGKPTSVGWPA